MPDYPYNIAANFAGLSIHCHVLLDNTVVQGLTTITDVVARTSTNPDDVVFTSSTTLSGAEETILDGVVSGYEEALGVVQTGDDSLVKIWDSPKPAIKLQKSADMVFFEAGHGFTLSGGAGTINDLTTGYDRPASIELISDGIGGQAKARNNSLTGGPFDLVNNYLVMVYKIDGFAELSTFSVYIGNSSLGNHFRVELGSGQAQQYSDDGEWVHRLVSPNELTASSGTADDAMLASIDSIQIRIIDDATASVTITVQELYLAPKPVNSYFSISFDDGDESIYTKAHPRMAPHGFFATSYVIVDVIGAGGRVTLPQLKELHEVGWEISPHAYAGHIHTESITDVGEEAVREDFRNLRNWCFDQGFRGAGQYALPHGEISLENDFGVTTTRRALAREFFTTIRTVLLQGMDTLPPVQPDRLTPLYITDSVSLTQAQDEVDAWLNAGAFPQLVFHKIVAGAPAASTEWNEDDFETLMQFIADHPKNPQCISMSDAVFVEVPRIGEINIEDLASTGNDGQVAMATGSGGVVLSNSMIQNSKTGLVDVMTNLISINADPAKIDVRASRGVVVNFDPAPGDPAMVDLVWVVPFEAITLPGLAANLVTAVFVVDGGGGVAQIELSNIFPSPTDRRTKLLIGFAFHAGASVVDAVDSAGVTGWDTGSSLDDLMSAVGDFNLSGNIYAANSGGNLLMDKGIGKAFGRGVDPGNINDQHNIDNPLQTGITFYNYSHRDSGSGFDTSIKSEIDPDFYDDGTGTLATTSNKYTIQRIVFTPRGGGRTAIEYGQALYNSLNEAIDAISANGVIRNPDLTSAILRGWLVVQGNTTDLTNTADAVFRENHSEIAQPSGAGTDVDAIHVNGTNEISGITTKATPVAGDLLVIEDSAAGNIKKSVTFSSLDARYAELSGAAFTGAITTTSTFDGRDVDADGTAQDTHIADTANPHGTDVGNLGTGTLAELNTAITDATLDTSSASRPPSGTAAGSLTGSYPNPGVADGADSTALHDDTAGEILAITLKAAPGGTDVLVLEDVSAANIKKRTTAAAIAASGPPATHALGGAEHSSATLAQLNALVSDATLDTSSASRTPTSHASSHSDGGSDEIKIEDLGATSTDDTLVFGPNGSGGVEAKAVPSPVFGSELNLVESLGESESSSTTFATKVRIPAADDITLPAGSYEVSATFMWQANGSNNMFVEVHENGTRIGLELILRPEISNDWRPETRNFTRTLTAGDYNWSVEFAREVVGVVKVRDVQMKVYRIS